MFTLDVIWKSRLTHKKKNSYYTTQIVNACRNWSMYLTGKLRKLNMHVFQALAMFPFPVTQLNYFLREFIQNILHRLLKQNQTTLLLFIILRNNITITNFTNQKDDDELRENKTMCSFQVTLIIIWTIKEKLWIKFYANPNTLSHK